MLMSKEERERERLEVFITKENEIIGLGNKIVVFKIIVINEVIRLGNEKKKLNFLLYLFKDNHTKN
jgi:hypothetical protein